MLRLLPRRSLLCMRRLSTEVEEKPKPRKFNKFKEETRMDLLLERESPLLSRAQGKAERPPLLRNLFLNRIDERFLTYPEVLDAPEVHHINQLYERLKAYVDSLDPLHLQQNIPAEVVDTLRSFGVYGALVPREFGGTDFTMTEFVRLLEAFATQPTLAATVIAHSAAGVSSIVKYGTPEQKAMFLPKLSSGEWMATLALHEPESGTDAASVQTKLELSVKEDHYVLNGTKTYVTNGQDAKLFVVICKMNLRNQKDLSETLISAALVERDSEGIKVEKAPENLGLKGSGLSTVTFDNVKVPFDCVLGKVGDGLDISLNIHNVMRCMLPAAVVSTAREAMNKSIEHAVKTYRYKKTLDEFQIARKHVTDMAGDVYAMESAIYFTTAIVDVVQDPDFVLEAAATRLFCTHASQRILNACFELTGAFGLADSHDLSRWFKDLKSFEAFETTPDVCRLLISLSGLQNAGRILESMIRVTRDPLTTPIEYLKIRVRRHYDKQKEPYLFHKLKDFIHPSLQKECFHLEYCMNRLAYATENAFEQFGLEIVQHQVLLEYLTNIAIDVYILAASISRASRSYCIGLQNSDDEIKLCQILADQVRERVDNAVDQMEDGFYGSTLYKIVDAGEKLFNNKKYALEHPLKRNWD